MRRPKFSLKKYFYFTLICALLLIFGFNLREHEIWKSKSASQQTQTRSAEEQAQQSLQYYTHSYNTLQPGNQAAALEAGDGGDDSDNESAALRRRANIISTGNSLPGEGVNSDQSEQRQQEQMHPGQIPLEPTRARLWFFRQGEYYPKPAPTRASHGKRGGGSAVGLGHGRKHDPRGARLFPHQDPHSDRIVNQLMYVPPNYEKVRASGRLKVILLYNGLGPWNVKQGRDVFLRSKCPVDTCELTPNRGSADKADMILYKDHFIPTGLGRPLNPKQVSLLYYLECPYHTQNVKVPDAINWTATYRRDSDIVTPYEKWVYYDSKIHQVEQDHNYALNKTKKVAWFVSNCGARNGRLQFAHELQKFIDVDIYGVCGNYKCSRNTADKCFELLDHDYKFYLAFENSNCKDYITEKFFVNALQRNILPIVMGARPEDYEVSAPHRSYIHVDEFASPKELAEYLHILDKDDELYNSYFKWKGTGEFINTYYWCRVCAALHDEDSLRKPRWYTDVNDWWRGAGVCTNGSWRNFKARKDVIRDD
ncbi:glycoprotein 3-alpha-L-fucosyltransferase A [Anastrepha ludens]|uniref:glycoprotein 3-alpha-L-fucosyltransferase A n=1 Tax=Anastrepha ludens TaxID=28586 RepID=UPI0023AF971F|nr:glycoprotein 3-alpha-L-fucosyltransferase A [Anastrepha ludens]XP_053954103.1 glycoprotein 3-alpha-L-fucosyltransferase A [Anastrepha ludens]